MIRIAVGFPRISVWMLLAASMSWPQSGLTPETLLIARIKVHMGENLERLPNYTCLQTIERSRRPSPSNRLELVDTLRLEVAFVDRKEMFAWPGAGKFEDRRLVDMVPGGTIGNGNFALHAHSVFLSSGPSYTYAGETMRGVRRTVRYDYRVPYTHSGYRLRVPPREARVAYHGSLWVDAVTLDLVRLEVQADDIPADLGIVEVSDAIEYGRVRIGESEFLLPRSSELKMVDLSGSESRNRAVFTECRQFTGESFLSFGDAPSSETPVPGRSIKEIELPAGLSLELHLDAEVDSRTSFVGDAVTAKVARPARMDKRIVVPKGAIAAGRIVRLERRTHPYQHFVVGLKFYSLEFGATRASFRASLEDLGPTFIGFGANARTTAVTGTPALKQGIFEVAARDRLQLPKGFRMLWRTEEPHAEEKQ